MKQMVVGDRCGHDHLHAEHWVVAQGCRIEINSLSLKRVRGDLENRLWLHAPDRKSDRSEVEVARDDFAANLGDGILQRPSKLTKGLDIVKFEPTVRTGLLSITVFVGFSTGPEVSSLLEIVITILFGAFIAIWLHELKLFSAEGRQAEAMRVDTIYADAGRLLIEITTAGEVHLVGNAS